MLDIMVPEVGLEPTRHFWRGILNPIEFYLKQQLSRIEPNKHTVNRGGMLGSALSLQNQPNSGQIACARMSEV